MKRATAAEDRVWQDQDVVATYQVWSQGGLTAAERHLVGRYVGPNDDVLDLGVGTGRTSPELAAAGARYVATDVSEPMVGACRAQLPGLHGVVVDSASLPVRNRSFDVVVYSFNGIDCLRPDSARRACLREVRRVLRPGGRFILSSHNPRALLADVLGDHGRYGNIGFRLRKTLGRLVRSARSPALWTGRGYVFDPVHGGIWLYAALPRHVRAELADAGFRTVEVIGSGFPRPGSRLRSPWFHYAAVVE